MMRMLIKQVPFVIVLVVTSCVAFAATTKLITPLPPPLPDTYRSRSSSSDNNKYVYTTNKEIITNVYTVTKSILRTPIYHYFAVDINGVIHNMSRMTEAQHNEDWPESVLISRSFIMVMRYTKEEDITCIWFKPKFTPVWVGNLNKVEGGFITTNNITVPFISITNTSITVTTNNSIILR